MNVTVVNFIIFVHTHMICIYSPTKLATIHIPCGNLDFEYFFLINTNTPNQAINVNFFFFCESVKSVIIWPRKLSSMKISSNWFVQCAHWPMKKERLKGWSLRKTSINWSCPLRCSLRPSKTNTEIKTENHNPHQITRYCDLVCRFLI